MDDHLKRIATRVRSWRDEAGLTLQQLGVQSGVSASTIHKVENLQTVPTIAILIKVANGLNRRPSELLAEAEVEKPVAVLSSGDRRTLTIEGRATVEHLIGTIPRNQLDVWRVVLQPGNGPGVDGDAWQFQGEIVVMVEDGELKFEIDDEEYRVAAGDSIHFDTKLPHRWYASGERPATIQISVLLPEHLYPDLMLRIATASGIGSVPNSLDDESVARTESVGVGQP